MRIVVMISLISLLLLLLGQQGTASLSFDFQSFESGSKVKLERNAYMSKGVIELTTESRPTYVQDYQLFIRGRASYEDPVRLWDLQTQQLVDFATRFTFSMKNLTNPPADGMAFFLAPFEPNMAQRSGGHLLGLVTYPGTDDNASFVAVEFDTYSSELIDPPSPHIGIDVNNILSKKTATWVDGNLTDGRITTSWVRYHSATQNLTVYLTYDKNPVFSERYCLLWYQVDLRKHLPEKVRVGFTASTGRYFQTNTLRSWSFNSSMDLIQNTSTNTSSGAPSPSPKVDPRSGNTQRKRNTNLAIGLGVGLGGATVSGIGIYLWFVHRRKRNTNEEEEDEFDMAIDGEFESGAGPKRFTYAELRAATSDFSEERKLGEGGFGGVYRGSFGDGQFVAVKRISKTSRQGQKEYISEVKIISRLGHRNLVQLIGWCHKKGEFLLVYEYLPNGSLDSHLFPGGKFLSPLPWGTRHRIAIGLASAVLYLHAEWEQCVVHRDIKSSNIMLDANFNAKLGDFGLARLVDHEYSLYTVAFAGTMGYIAPECHETGKSSKESDVYSFGVVALEICCGRRSILANPIEESRVRLVNWVWELYSRGQLLEAVDERLGAEFEAREIECLMIVGLWCCHPDPGYRPVMKQVMSVLKFEAPLPYNLPRELPRAMYCLSSFNVSLESYDSSAYTGSSTASANSAVKHASKPLLKADC